MSGPCPAHVRFTPINVHRLRVYESTPQLIFLPEGGSGLLLKNWPSTWKQLIAYQTDQRRESFVRSTSRDKGKVYLIFSNSRKLSFLKIG